MMTISFAGEGLQITSELCPDFRIGPLFPKLTVDNMTQIGNRAAITTHSASNENFELLWTFEPLDIQLKQRFETGDDGAIRVFTRLINRSNREVCLNAVQLLAGNEQTEYTSRGSTNLRFYERGGYSVQVRRGNQKSSLFGVAEDPTQAGNGEGDSQHCWVCYDDATPFSWLAGFQTAERWDGHIRTAQAESGAISGWEIGFDGGDLLIDPNQEIELDEIVFLAGSEPYELLEKYGDLVAARHQVSVLPRSPVTWCSWYPYRLGVTQEKVLANARIAAQRLKALGLEVFELDLGWEKDYLPNAYTENRQFPGGLSKMRDELAELGFRLGVWKAVFTVSEFDEIAIQHPEWLLSDESGTPIPLGSWFWAPHGAIYAPDLTNPEVQQWLRFKIRSLLEKGASYFKLDFIRMPTADILRHRDNPRLVAGGGNEATRLGMGIIVDEARKFHETPYILNCGLPDLPGTGHANLLYSCMDTGNTGYSGFRFAKDNYGKNLAGNLWKQGRWGTIQPSCLCVGLPGTLEEARLRATITFLCGGQVDISDDLTLLPEDRWQVLLCTLPPTGKPARPVDLFETISCTSISYEQMCRGNADSGAELEAGDGASRVWHLAMENDWDRWQLVGLFNYDRPQPDGAGSNDLITCFQIPLKVMGLVSGKVYWAFEFWSGQFLGTTAPAAPDPLAPAGYMHPGDASTLVALRRAEYLDVSFFGPAVKLLVFREAREHPWVVGTSFHQSGGTELRGVQWQAIENGGVLSGELHRPAGQQGDIFIAGLQGPPSQVLVGGHAVPWRHAANGSIVVPILCLNDITHWQLQWT